MSAGKGVDMHWMTRLAALTLASAVAVVAHAAPTAKLAALQIEIWPEYDRPHALVILKGELPADATLPAQVALRIPAASGGPTAVAYADASEQLLNLAYDQAPAGPFLRLALEVPQRFFRVEFYEALDAATAARQYRYTWPGDMAVERLAVLVKEPAAASELLVEPKLEITGSSPDGFRHRGAVLGSLKAGQTLPVSLSYRKSDPRPSVEILGAAGTAAPVEGPAMPDGPPMWPLALAAAGLGGLLLVAGVLLWQRRKAPARAADARQPALFCGKCGKRAQADDRFCSHCGEGVGR